MVLRNERSAALCGAWLAILTGAGVGCSSNAATPPDASPFGPGVAFTYPTDGQIDIPIGARLLLHMTDPVDASALSAACSVDDSGTVTGNFCIVGPGGVVPATVTLSGATQNVILATSNSFVPGTAYHVYARPALLGTGGGGTTGNLPAAAALFSFETRQQAPIPGSAPVIATVNDEPPAAFQDGSGTKPRLPFLDFSTLHIIFSEPLDERTVTAGSTFTFGSVATDGTVTPVNGELLVRGIHLTFDPDADLDPKTNYVVNMTAGITDLGGEAMAPITLNIHPLASASSDGTHPKLALSVSPPANPDGTAGGASALAGVGANSVDTSSPLLGETILGLLPGNAITELADPGAFGGPVIFTLRKGQQLDVSNLVFKLDGELPTGPQTGTNHFLILTDANGSMTRSPLQPQTQVPDDKYSPVTVDMVFDAAQFSDDTLGNAVATQTLLGVHVRGTAIIDNGQLSIETVGAIELDALGITLAPGNMVMSLVTTPTGEPTYPAGPLVLLDSFPLASEADFPIDENPIVTFSHPVELATPSGAPAISLTDQSGANIPVTLLTLGSGVVVLPSAPLAYGTQYALDLTQVVDLQGNPAEFDADDATAGTGTLTFSTPIYSPAHPDTPPLLLGLYPGSPCALTGATATSPGHCVSGLDTDLGYQPFTLAANRKIDAFFSQPIDPASVVVGTSCGQGSVRVEQVDTNGNCLNVVPGTLTKLERELSFTPATPWVTGTTYQLTLVAGPDLACDAGEICGAASHLPLDTNPLAGVEGHGGVPDIVIPFTATDATTDGYVPLVTVPIADTNGDGYLDPGEPLQPLNEFEIEVSGTSGLITSATLAGDDCDPNRDGTQICGAINAATPVDVGTVIPSCPMDLTGASVTNGPPCVPVRVHAGIVTLTALTLTANITALGVTSVTGMQVQRSNEPNGEPIIGFIIEDATNHPQFVAHESLYLDTPDLSILGGLATANTHSLPVDALLVGPITNLSDGRMQVHLVTAKDITITINISALGLGTGSVSLLIPAGGLTFNLRGPARR